MQSITAEFAIQRAEHIFPNEKKDEVGTLYQAVERRLGTDGMLYLYEKELLLIADELEALDYTGVEGAFSKIESELASTNTTAHGLSQQQQTFEGNIAARLTNIKQSLDQCEPQYNNWDMDGPLENYSESEEDDL